MTTRTTIALLATGVTLAACGERNILTVPQRTVTPTERSSNITASPTNLWIRQFGTSATDNMNAVATGDNGVFVVGSTGGALGGESSAGGNDAYVRRLGQDGSIVWTREFGTSGDESANAVAVHSTGVYVGGSTDGALGGEISNGFTDGYVRKYGLDGTLLWTRLVGSSFTDVVTAIAVDESGVYVFGTATAALPGQSFAGVSDAFLRKYDHNGNVLWTRQFGTSSYDQAWAIAATGDAVYIGGQTGATLPGQTSSGGTDAYLRKYDPNGNELWTRQFGAHTFFDPIAGIVANASGVYVTGATAGALPGQTSAGDEDAFVRKYDPAGNELWTRQFGTTNVDGGYGIALDASGLYVLGRTYGILAPPGSGGGDVFVRKYDFNGNTLWTEQGGSSSADLPGGIALDATGVYATGLTNGSLPGQASAGAQDAFIVKLRLSSAPVDNTPPVIVANVNGTLGDHGWYTSDVTVSWTVTDAQSTVTSPACAPTTISTNTTGTLVSCSATSAGGSATQSVTIKRDADKPVITFTGNAGSYSVDQTIGISCSASDAVSGVASDSCASPVTGPGYTFALGTNTITATAIDNAGNTVESATTFVVTVNAASLCALVERMVTKAGVANSLCAKLRAGAPVQAFVNEVQAQTGKAISAADAEILIRLAGAL